MGKVVETVADSIAIEILDKSTILTGKGNELHLYFKHATEENVYGSRVLPITLTNKIHGIRKSQRLCDKVLLVYGEKEFLLIEYSDSLNFREVYRAKLSDWISCGSFLNDPQEVVLLTAHSTILRFSYQISERNCYLKERISCTDKSTLYSAHLFGDNWNKLIVFGGNAFGELLIWQPRESVESKDKSAKPKVSPLLHRVSAHNGVIFSIDYDYHSQCLITTSDDRAIKWWKVEFTSPSNWSESNLHALSSGYGHVARVFHGRIIKDGPYIYALSVGEDSYFCLWNKNGKLLFKRRQQYGAIIWNFEYDYSSKTIYTIGSTGNLVAFGLSKVLNETQNPKGDSLLPILSNANSAEYIAKIKFLNEHHLIAVTNQNNLMTSKFLNEEWQNWEHASIKIDFKCTVMEVKQNIIAICGYKRLILLEYQDVGGNLFVLVDEEILKGVIRTFVFLTKHQYLICDDQGSCVILVKSVKERRYLQLPKCKEPWITTALLLSQQQHIVVSNRLGNLLLYQLQSGSDYYELKYTIKHPHGNLGATSLQYMEEGYTSALILSTGHDGALNIFAIDFKNNTMQTCSRQIIPVAWVESIEKLLRDGLELFLGFNDNHFVVWSKDYDFLLQMPCGGGHRCWNFVINPENDTISLVFVRNKRVRFYKMPLLNKELTSLPLAKRWHVAPCNAMEILPKTSSSPHIAVSAGDDNLLKIHTFNEHTGLKELKELQSHISNIRCLKLISLNNNEFLVFSGGGRAQLCVTKVNSSNFHLQELISYTLKTVNCNKINNESYNFDPETRLMALDVKVLNNDEYEVYVGCSDGFIKHLKLDMKKMEFTLLAQSFYGKCILQIRYLTEIDLVLAAATDGLLKIFDSQISECLSQLNHHFSGVNCLSVLYKTSNKSLHILSGGDDQSVSYTELLLNDFKIINQLRKPNLHTSQVCACALTSTCQYGFTSGVDQVLNKIDLSTGEVIESFYSCVADIKGVALIEDNVCLLYGCGLQIYAFNR